MDNLFPNTQWQLWTALGPGWDGAIPITTHLSQFDTEWNWLYSGNLSAINISAVAPLVSVVSGQRSIEVMGDNNVQYLYPGAIVVFYGSVHASLQRSPMRVRTVNYTNKSFTLLAIRNEVPPAATLSGAGCRSIMRCDRGMNGGQGQGHGPDGWTKTAGAYIWPDRWPRVPIASDPTMTFNQSAVAPHRPAWLCNQRPSTKRLVVFQPRSSAEAYFYHTVSDWRTLCGRNMVFGMWVRRIGSTGTGRLYVNDGAVTYSSGIVNSSAWTWIEMTHKVANAPAFDVSFGFAAQNSNGVCWQIAEPRLDYGTAIGEGNYVRPKGKIERFVVKVTPDSYFGADYVGSSSGTSDYGYGHTFDIFAETGGAIAEDVAIAFAQFELTADTADRAVSIRNAYSLPHRFGPVVRAAAAGAVCADSGPIELHNDGTCWIFADDPAAMLTDVSIDINQAVLW